VRIEVVWATPELQDIVVLDLPEGATVADALARSGLVAHYGIDLINIGFALHGRRTTAEARLSDGDRVELTRPLEADPKSARIARARLQKRHAARRPQRAADGIRA